MSEEERAKFLGNVRREAERMRRIVDRMLELASIESRRGLQNTETIDVVELIEDVIAIEQSQPAARQIRIDCIRNENPQIRGERFLVRQAIFNALRNAIEFSSEGGCIEIIVTPFRKVVEVAIEDSGPGVPDYALERVFERFYSLPRPGTGEKSSGVGLSFVKEIMILHGGTVEIVNLEKAGARLVMRFPK